MRAYELLKQYPNHFSLTTVQLEKCLNKCQSDFGFLPTSLHKDKINIAQFYIRGGWPYFVGIISQFSYLETLTVTDIKTWVSSLVWMKPCMWLTGGKHQNKHIERGIYFLSLSQQSIFCLFFFFFFCIKYLFSSFKGFHCNLFLIDVFFSPHWKTRMRSAADKGPYRFCLP